MPQAGARNEGTQSPVWSASASFDGGSGAGSGSDTEPEEAAPVRRTHSPCRAPAEPALAAADAGVDPAEYDAPFLDPQTTDAEIANTLKCGADTILKTLRLSRRQRRLTARSCLATAPFEAPVVDKPQPEAAAMWGGSFADHALGSS